MDSLRWPWLFIFVLLFATLAINLSHSLHGTDECREAGIAREMADSSDFVVPRLNGKPFLEKPPLFYAATALSIRLLGPSETAARIPSSIFALCAVLAVFAAGKRFSGSSAGGVVAAIALGTSRSFQEAAHHCVTDIAVAATVSLAFWAFERIVATDQWFRWGVLFYTALAFGFLSKNLFGVAIPGIATLAYVILGRDVRCFRRIVFNPGIFVFLTVGGFWVRALYQAGQREPPGGLGLVFLRETLVANNFGRFTGVFGGHTSARPYEVIAWLAAALLPWTPLAVLAAVDVLRKAFSNKPLQERRSQLLLVAWMIVPATLIAASQSKRASYMVALIAPFATAVGAWWQETSANPAWRARRLIIACAAIAASSAPAVLAARDYSASGKITGTALCLPVVAIFLLAVAVWTVRTGGAERLSLLTALGAVTFSCGWLDGAIVEARDRVGEGPFHREVSGLAHTGELGAVGYGEREFGSAYFYLGRTITDLNGRTPVDLGDFLDRPGTAGILLAHRKSGDVVPTAKEAIRFYFGEHPPPMLIRDESFSAKRRLVFIGRAEQ
ncbi:MAG TPA: glycosyltransferase family 39 protein [Acidobacteriota bacterium]|jgi:4-amino-4-deoxy-L-arabinose transferase-like glycosyltransferase